MRLRIGELLQERGLTQADLARGLGYSQSTVSKWVAHAHQPPVKDLDRLATFFNVSALDLFANGAVTNKQREILKKLQNADPETLDLVDELITATLRARSRQTD